MEMIDIKRIKPNPNNPRVIKDDKFKKLVKSMQEFPEMSKVRPIVINKDYIVLGGNMRLKAMQEAGWDKVPVKQVFWNEEKQRQFIIKDNASFGEWDWETLANEWEIEELEEWGLDVPNISLFQEDAEEDDYEIPDEIETDIVIGDLIEIGEHRLLCGDSTVSTYVDKLLNNKEPYLMVTDPPYGVEYNPKWRADVGVNKNNKKMGNVSNDNNADWTDAWSLSPSRVAYVWHAGKFTSTVQDSLERCDFEIRSQIIWSKDKFALSRGNYHWQHEPCWYAVKKGNKGNWAGDRKQSTVWNINAREDSGHGHGTQKPVECMAKPIKNHDGDVYDPFLGSGTTMVAAHQLNRKCYGIELDPKYCQVIVERMLKLDSTLELKRNGQKWTL